MIYNKYLRISILLILGVAFSNMFAQINIKVGDVITIGRDGYYMADWNQTIDREVDVNDGDNIFRGLPVKAIHESEGLDNRALWKIENYRYADHDFLILRNFATNNVLSLYQEYYPNQMIDIRVFKESDSEQVGRYSFAHEPFHLIVGTVTTNTGVTMPFWKLKAQFLGSPEFSPYYKDGYWVLSNASDWQNSHSNLSNTIGSINPETFDSIPESEVIYQITGLQSAYPVAGGGGMFDLEADINNGKVDKITGTYYLSSDGETKIYANRDTVQLEIENVTLTATQIVIANQQINDSKIVFPANTTTNSRTSIIEAEYTFQDDNNAKNLTLDIEFLQVPKIDVSSYVFKHKENNTIQPVHTDTRIIYALPNQKRHLSLPLEENPNYKKGFYRWYNYNTDTTANALLFGNSKWEKFANGKGAFLFYGDDLNQNTPDGTYYMFTGNPIKVAVDISEYTNYTISGNIFTEPTLSNRVIYDIRNASEIAKKLDNTTPYMPLEHYTIYAPCGEIVYIGPAYKWNGADCNYFVNKSGSEYPVSINGNAVWTKNGTEFTPNSVHDSRLIPIETPQSPNLANPDEYILYADKAKTKVIAHFHVYVSLKEKIGPAREQNGKALFTHAELDEKYKLVGATDFNTHSINTPLEWEQSTYGFYYNNIKRANGIGGSIVDGEYIIQNTFGGISNHSGENGNFVYVKTNSYPGKIADLRIEEGQNLCPGAPVFISAWVANMGDSDPHASLRFEVIGVNNDGRKDNLMTFITGEIPTGGWHQIIFQVQLGQIYYDEYHLHIENNGHSVSNDFAIDDIRMYTKKPLLDGISGLSACDMNKNKNLAALRVDYCQLSKLGVNDSLYYRWSKGKPESLGMVLDLNYINGSKGTRLQPCGAIEIISEFIPSNNSNPNFTPSTITNAGKKYYPSIESFLYSNAASGNAQYEAIHEFYTIEEGHIILYIVHSSDLFKEGEYYTAQLMERIPEFSNIQCGAYYTYEVRPRTALTIDGVVYDDAIVKNLSINDTHTLGIQVYGFDSNGNLTKSSCNADWFKYKEKLSDYVITALRDFRYEYPTTTTLEAPKGIFTQNDYNLLKPLINDYTLRLNRDTIKITVDEGVLNYIAIPVIATSISHEFMACDNPLYITLGAEVVMSYAKNDGDNGAIPYDELPIELQGTPPIKRVAYSKINSELNTLSFKIDFLGEGFTHLETNEVVLCTPDHNGPTVYQITNDVTTENSLKVTKKLTFKKINDNFKFEAGKSYTFHCKGYDHDRKVNPGTFVIYVVPDIVIWNPRHAGLSTAWHNDDNWASIESYNNPNATTRGFIPTSETNVIIPELLDTKYAPLLSKSNRLESGSNTNLEYEFGIEFNSCKNIYFDENAALANHHLLTYEKAYIDMHFEHNDGTFELKSVPLNEVVSGDFYVPKAGDEATTGNIETFNFGTVATVDTRVANKFTQKIFNASITQYAGTEQNVVKCETSTWSTPTNALNMPWQVGRGYAIAKQTTTTQDYVRLPKSTTSYCFYYDNNGQEGELPFTSTTITRTSQANKLAYEGGDYDVTIENDVVGKIFLVGNPFMCDLSINQLYSTYDGDLENKFYYTYKDGILSTEFITNNTENYISPMDAIFVMTKYSRKSLSLSFDASMMYYREYDKNVSQAPIRRTKELDETLTITARRNDRISKTNIEVSSNATNKFTTEEDVPALLLDPELTPFAIYSIADSQAIAHNKVNDIYMIPLSINVIDGEDMGDITFEFSGIDHLSQFIYLYDSYEDRYISLAEGDIFNYDVDGNQAVRYYITSRRAGDITTELDESMIEMVKILNLGEGEMMVYASENINSLNVYDITGKLIIHESDVNAPRHNITLPQGNVYVFEIRTESTITKKKVVTH